MINLTRTKRHDYTDAWYGPEDHHCLSGIALYKEFPTSRHTFSLIKMTKGGSDNDNDNDNGGDNDNDDGRNSDVDVDGKTDATCTGFLIDVIV